MIDRHHLQPINAKPYERSISEAMDYTPDLSPASGVLRGFKFDPPDLIVPYLIAEYGLTEIEDFVPDPRVVLREGIIWQRLRGTPASLHQALRWIAHDGLIEEMPPQGFKWWWFQVHLQFEVRNTDFVKPMNALAKASKPLRSEFARVTSGWDVRAFQLNKHRLNGGAYLNSWSGIKRSPNEPVLSLRVNQWRRIMVPTGGKVTVKDTSHVAMFRKILVGISIRQQSARFASTAAVGASYRSRATVTFQNAPFTNKPFGAPVPRIQTGN